MIIPSPPNQYLQLQKLHLYLCAGVAISIIVFYFVMYKPDKIVDSRDTFGLILEAIVPVFSLISVFIGNFMAKRTYSTFQEKDELSIKMAAYQKASLVKWSTILGSVFLSIVAFYLTGRNNFILYALMLGIFLIYLRPIKSRIKEELKLNDNEYSELKKE